MPSYQEIETRLQVVEDKIDYILTQFKAQKRNKFTDELVTVSMLDMYHDARQVKEFDAR